MGRGLAYEKLGRDQEAMADYKKIKYMAALHFLSSASNKYGKPELIQDVEKVVKIGSDFWFDYTECARLYVSVKQHQQAIDVLSKAVELNPNIDETYLVRGINYSILGQDQKAIDDYTKAIELNPEFADAYYFRGNIKKELNQDREAIDDFTKAIKFAVDVAMKANSYRGRGLVYWKIYSLSAACDDYYQAGLLYLEQGERAEALECVDTIKQIDSTSSLSKKLMDKIYEEE